jgi:raffinose/stachyose/melibiose transport system permease protein
MFQASALRPAPTRARNLIPFGSGRRRRWIPIFSVLLPGLGWLLFGFYPTIATFFYSLTQYSGLPGTPLNFRWFYNYVQGFTTDFTELTSTLKITLEYAAGVVLLQNGVGLALALLLNRRGKSFSFYRALVFIPQVLSVIVVGIVFALLFDPFSGPMERIYEAVTGGGFSSFFGSSNIALSLLIIVTAWAGVGFSMVVYIAGLRNIPREFYEAVAVDGGGRFSTFRYVTWPLLAGATTVNVFLTVTFCIAQYALILVLTDGMAGTMTLGMYMFISAFGGSTAGASTNLGFGSMLMVLNFAVIFLVGGGVLWLLRRREVQL